MSKKLYKTPKEWLGIGEDKEYFFILKDGSEIVYNIPKQSRRLQAKEKLRAVFLVKLIEKYHYSEKNIRLDVEVNNLGFADLVVLKNKKPFIVIDFNQPNQKQIIKKARKLGAKYAALITKSSQSFFDLSLDPPKLILNIPFN